MPRSYQLIVILVTTGLLSLATHAEIVTEVREQAVVATRDRPAARSELANAVEAFRAGDLNACEESLQKARAENPGLPAARLLKCRVTFACGQLNVALASTEAYLQQNPDDPQAYKLLGEIALASGRPTDAWLQFQHAKQLAHGAGKVDLQADLLRLSGETAEKRRDYESALDAFGQLSKKDPQDGSLLWKIGRLKVLLGETDEGAQLMRAAVQSSPGLPQPELTVALLLGADADAERWFRSGIRASNGADENWFVYLNWLLEQDRSVEVLELVEKLHTTKGEQGVPSSVSLLQAVALRCQDLLNRSRCCAVLNHGESHLADERVERPRKFHAANVRSRGAIEVHASVRRPKIGRRRTASPSTDGHAPIPGPTRPRCCHASVWHWWWLRAESVPTCVHHCDARL